VAPGSSGTFTFFAHTSAGSQDDATNSRAWAYYADSAAHIHAGLVGAVVVVDAGTSDSSSGLPSGVDAEYAVFLGAFDENQSPLASANFAAGLTELRTALGGDAVSDADFAAAVANLAATNADFAASNVMFGANGRAFCTLGGLVAPSHGARVRFHVLSSRVDSAAHSVALNGHSLTTSGSHRQQAVELFAGAAATFTVTAASARGDSSSTWELHDGDGSLFAAGARAELTVPGDDGVYVDEEVAEPARNTRRFYIAADEVEWEYVPLGYNKCHNSGFSHDPVAQRYLSQGPHRIGSKYVKAQYRRYSDDTFNYLQSGSQSRANGASWHLGLLGTVITVQVGERLEVVFKNNLRFPANFVPAGPFAAAALQEGEDSSSTSRDPEATAAVAPGATKTYTWVVTEDMGPAAGDANSVVWSYSAKVEDEAAGVTSQGLLHAGLVGAVIVAGAGEMKPTQTMPQGVDSEFVVLTGTIDENLSPYLGLNVQRYAGEAYSLDTADAEFQESNRMRAINGLMYCNGEGWVGIAYKHARFYVLGMDSGLESVNLHSHSLVDQRTSHNAFSVNVAASGTTTADVIMSSAGDWLLQTAQAADQPLGAQVLFTVHPLVTQFFRRNGRGFQQRDTYEAANAPNSVLGNAAR
jgi:hephaestin